MGIGFLTQFCIIGTGERQNPRKQLVLRLSDLVIVPEQMRAWTPAQQPVWRPALRSETGASSGKPQSHGHDSIDTLAKEAEPLLFFRDGGLAANGSGHLPDRP
jgi:hypothetical protein